LNQSYRITGVIVVLIICGSISGAYILFTSFSGINPTATNTSYLSWEIHEGDEFNYDISVRLHDRGCWVDSPPVVRDDMDGTTIKIQITNLPELPPVINKSYLVNGIIKNIKINCTFQNGTELNSTYFDWFNQYLSMAFLPAGNWTFFDAPFTDSYYRTGGYPSTFYSKIAEGHFVFGYWTSTIDSGYGWESHIDMALGIPLQFVYDIDDEICESSYLLSFTLLD
jgi:hypothetical protein